ncbi:hypothetical protein DERP_000923 [Dermatophagoides pteronyssinus]|uniref:Uncharacterized protein n=1 Tax=Dermatophagoides pteronyssinus TaxID=6956 RepID=A0ABQ8JDJ6_DERPT|nr:hypothetical protein DERP_000923 [Dermatophagoides pteronyssinus]
MIVQSSASSLFLTFFDVRRINERLRGLLLGGRIDDDDDDDAIVEFIVRHGVFGAVGFACADERRFNPSASGIGILANCCNALPIDEFTEAATAPGINFNAFYSRKALEMSSKMFQN